MDHWDEIKRLTALDKDHVTDNDYNSATNIAVYDYNNDNIDYVIDNENLFGYVRSTYMMKYLELQYLNDNIDNRMVVKLIKLSENDLDYDWPLKIAPLVMSNPVNVNGLEVIYNAIKSWDIEFDHLLLGSGRPINDQLLKFLASKHTKDMICLFSICLAESHKPLNAMSFIRLFGIPNGMSLIELYKYIKNDGYVRSTRLDRLFSLLLNNCV